MEASINTHHLVVTFGRYEGERWTRVPVGYLRWMLNHPTHIFPEGSLAIAQAELARRGTAMPTTVEISGHALDRASLRLLDYWRHTRRPGEGLYTWLLRLATEAYTGEEEGLSQGVRFVYDVGEYYPTVKTVQSAK